jgi:Na+/proline symporter
MNQIIIISAIVCFLIVGLWIKKQKVESILEFTLNKNAIGWFPISAGISMTFAGGAALLNMASLGYMFKWYTLVDPLSLLGGILIVIFLIKKYRNDNGVTIAKLLAGSNKSLTILVGIISSIVFILILAAQFVALSKLLYPYFPSIDSIVLTITLSTTIFSYIFLGGFSSVTKTDVLQLVFIGIFLLIPVLYFVLFGSAHQETVTYNHSFTKMPLNLIILLSISLLFIPLSQDINIRAKSAKTNNQAILGLLVGAGLYVAIVTTSSYLGINLATNGVALKDPETAFSIFFQTHFPSIGVIAVVAALSAIISTMDSYALNSITAISNDLLAEISFFKKQKTKHLIRISGVIAFLMALAIALFFNQILGLILAALLLYISVLLPIALGRYLKVHDKIIFIVSILIVLSIVLVEIFKISIEPKAIYYPLGGLALMVLTRIGSMRQIIR